VIGNVIASEGKDSTITTTEKKLITTTSKRSVANLNRFHKEKIENHFKNLKIEINLK
tara:strand:- start:1370 stop:1540 length:171 start_codon:yes stop_codon:yes gene_type:complete